MRIESHIQAFESHKRTIFTWGLEIEGLEKAQKIVGLHASRAILELLAAFLHKKKLVDEGFQLNHRWFKSGKVEEKLPPFEHKQEIVSKLIELENLCENLAYGSEKPVQKTKDAIILFKQLEEEITKL